MSSDDDLKEGRDQIAAAKIGVETLLDVIENRLPLQSLLGSELQAAESWILRTNCWMTAPLWQLLGRQVDGTREDDGFRHREREILVDTLNFLEIGASESRCGLAKAMTRFPCPLKSSISKPRLDAYRFAVKCAWSQFSLGWSDFDFWETLNVDVNEDDLHTAWNEVYKKIFADLNNQIVDWEEVPHGWEPSVIGESVLFPSHSIRNERELSDWLREFKWLFQYQGSFPLTVEYKKRFENVRRELRNTQRALEHWGSPIGAIEFNDVYDAERELVRVIGWLDERDNHSGRNSDKTAEHSTHEEAMEVEEHKGIDPKKDPGKGWQPVGKAPPIGFFGPLEGQKKQLARWILGSDPRTLNSRIDGINFWGREVHKYLCEVYFVSQQRYAQANKCKLSDPAAGTETQRRSPEEHGDARGGRKQ